MQDFKDNEYYMRKAIELAEKAASMGEVPVGAVVVNKKSGEITGMGYNRRETDKSPLAHAEIMAINEASQNMGGWRLLDSIIYVTLEPCPMCSGAIINARIDDVVFGAYDLKSGSVRSVQHMFEKPYNYKPNVTCGVLEEECAKLLSEFFRELRLKRKK
jgi:tRNA(adenine34) deaminase